MYIIKSPSMSCYKFKCCPEGLKKNYPFIRIGKNMQYAYARYTARSRNISAVSAAYAKALLYNNFSVPYYCIFSRV